MFGLEFHTPELGAFLIWSFWLHLCLVSLTVVKIGKQE